MMRLFFALILAVAGLPGLGGFATAASTLEVAADQIVIYVGRSGYNNVTLQVLNDMEIKNTGAETVPRVELPLATGHFNAKIEQGAGENDVEWSESSFTDPRGLKAGESRHYSFSYNVAYPALPNVLPRPLLQRTLKLTVAVPAEELEVETADLVDQGVRPWGDASARVYESASPLAPDQGFVLKVKRVKAGISPWFWAWVLLLGLPVVGMGMIFWRGSRLKRSRVQNGGR